MLDSEPLFQGNQVHIWKVPLPLSEEKVARLNECLDSEERKKGGNFYFAQDRQRFITARGALRTILSSYLNERPDALRFGYGIHGKPFLVHPAATSGVAFNLSHCADMAVIGVASGRSIGVDVETIRSFPEINDIAEQHFSKEEQAAIGLARDEERVRLFFHVWTRREAAAKARGLNLVAALSDLRIPFYPPGSGMVLGGMRNCDWSLWDIQLGPSHVGAACVKGNTYNEILRDFDLPS